ncbi:MAG: hypothetical protein ACKO13_01255, partial [Cytophagales bacterium]
MKNVAIITWLVFLLACHKNENSATVAPAAPDNVQTAISATTFTCDKGDSSTSITLTGQWTLVRYHNMKLGTTESQPTNIKRAVIMNFCDDGKMGNIYGQTVANSVGGEYELSNENKMKTLIFY